MAWIILEGLDRTGKSTVADHYKELGYQVVHMSAPDKKYSAPGYVGPSYFEELVDIYMRYDGQNVVFDRSPYGELIWPKVYGRNSQLTFDDFEFLSEYEDKNETIKILMHDTDLSAHWERCKQNNEPLNENQFKAAVEFFKVLNSRFNFEMKTLPEMEEILEKQKQEEGIVKQEQTEDIQEAARPEKKEQTVGSSKHQQKASKEEVDPISKLERANAINKVLSKPIIKQKGDMYDELENDIRNFLKDKLDELFGKNNNKEIFDNTEVKILKTFCESMRKKMEVKK